MTDAAAPIALAERILTLLEVGSFSATYKYALLAAILDLCIERTSASGDPPATLTTRQLAEKVTELYWPHATPYEGERVLRQGGVRSGTQAEILSAIAEFRAAHAGAPGELFHRARLAHVDRFERLLRTVEWKLIEMPLPRLQVVGRGGDEDRFLYDYGWTQAITRGPVSAYQNGERGAFDNRILLRSGVAKHLVALNGVLRPIIHRDWAVMVAAMNALPEQRLEEFLFGATRVPLDAVRSPLRELQDDRCFYCDARLGAGADVDHFIPWARYPENAIDNLVAAHSRCNNSKRDFFAAYRHLERWVERSRRHAADLADIAANERWPRDAERSRSVARAMYTRLPEGARLWIESEDFELIDRHRVRAAFEALS